MAGIVYQPLNRAQREIRLIILESDNEIISCEGARSTPLRCQLITTSLAFYNRTFDDDIKAKIKLELAVAGGLENPVYLLWELYELQKFMRRRVPQILQRKPASYVALSYIWGDPEYSHDVEVNGKIAKITKNLAEALHSIQANTKIRIIWADVIYINQQDDVEKSWQISEMAAIYKCAALVVSWLGPSTAETEFAFAALRNLKLRQDSSLDKLPGHGQPSNYTIAALKNCISIYLRFIFKPFTSSNVVAAFEDAVSIFLEEPEHRNVILFLANQPY